MNDGRMILGFLAAKKVIPLIFYGLTAAIIILVGMAIRDSGEKYTASMETLRGLAESGAVPPELIGAIEGMGAILAGAIALLYVLYLISITRRR